MHFQMSSASVPNPLGGEALPQQTPSRPEIVKPIPPKRRPRGIAWGLAALVIIAGAALYLNLNRDRVPPENGGGGPPPAAFPTAGFAHRGTHHTPPRAGTTPT